MSDRASAFQLRAYVLIDSMQPQYAAFLGTVSRGDVPVAGMAQAFLELAPGSQVYPLLDIALKTSEVGTSFQDVEREFGMLEIHAPSVEVVKDAVAGIFSRTGLSAEQSEKPRLVSSKIITNITPQQAQLVNRFRQGSLLLPGESLLIMEVEPAVYITYVTNEVEKRSEITLVHFDPVGRYGRLYVSGTQDQVMAASAEASRAVDRLTHGEVR